MHYGYVVLVEAIVEFDENSKVTHLQDHELGLPFR